MLIFSYPLFLTYVLGAQKNRLIETVLVSTQNICFVWEIKKKNFLYALLTKGLAFCYIILNGEEVKSALCTVFSLSIFGLTRAQL